MAKKSSDSSKRPKKLFRHACMVKSYCPIEVVLFETLDSKGQVHYTVGLKRHSKKDGNHDEGDNSEWHYLNPEDLLPAALLMQEILANVHRMYVECRRSGTTVKRTWD